MISLTVDMKPVNIGNFQIFVNEPIKWNRKDPERMKLMLSKIRAKGGERRRHYEFYWKSGYYPEPQCTVENNMHSPNRYKSINYIMSTAMRQLFHGSLSSQKVDGGIFLDAGCGDSCDADVALLLGYDKAYAVDLIEHSQGWHKYNFDSEFICADLCEKIPLKRKTVDAVSSSAVIGLMDRNERLLFYKQVKHVLKRGGLFSLYGIYLVSGHGLVHISEEAQVLVQLGFEIERRFNESAVFRLKG
jgi:SAM-dependent methyltransferase